MISTLWSFVDQKASGLHPLWQKENERKEKNSFFYSIVWFCWLSRCFMVEVPERRRRGGALNGYPCFFAHFKLIWISVKKKKKTWMLHCCFQINHISMNSKILMYSISDSITLFCVYLKEWRFYEIFNRKTRKQASCSSVLYCFVFFFFGVFNAKSH